MARTGHIASKGRLAPGPLSPCAVLPPKGNVLLPEMMPKGRTVRPPGCPAARLSSEPCRDSRAWVSLSEEPHSGAEHLAEWDSGASAEQSTGLRGAATGRPPAPRYRGVLDLTCRRGLPQRRGSLALGAPLPAITPLPSACSSPGSRKARNWGFRAGVLLVLVSRARFFEAVNFHVWVIVQIY